MMWPSASLKCFISVSRASMAGLFKEDLSGIGSMQELRAKSAMTPPIRRRGIRFLLERDMLVPVP